MSSTIVPKLLSGSLLGTGLAVLGHRALNLSEEGDMTKLYSHGASLGKMPKELREAPNGPCNIDFDVQNYLFCTEQEEREKALGYARSTNKSWLQMKDIGKEEEGVVIDFTAESPNGGKPKILRGLLNRDPRFEHGTKIHVKNVQKVAPDIVGIKDRQEFVNTIKRIQSCVDGNSIDD